MSLNKWQTFSLGSLCEAIFDGPHATPEKTEAGPVYLGISNLTNGRIDLSDTEYLSEEDFIKWTRRVTPQPNDLVFSYETRLGEAALIPNGLRCCLGRRMGLLRFDTTKVDPKFMLYAYLGPEFQQTIRERTIHGSTVDRIPLIQLPDFPIAIPDLPTQRRIADILAALDDKIELNRQTNATLEAIAQAIFKEWFVQNEDVDGWEVVPLSEIIDVNPNRPLRKDEIAPYLDMANVPTQGHRAIEWRERAFSSGTKFINGDTLLARITPCLENGKTAFVDFLDAGKTGWGSTEFIVFRPKLPFPPEYGYYLARSNDLRTHAIRNMVGSSGRQRVPSSSFDNFLLPVPPAELANRFGLIAGSIMEKIAASDNESRFLAQMRDQLLPKLMRGEVSINDLEMQL